MGQPGGGQGRPLGLEAPCLTDIYFEHIETYYTSVTLGCSLLPLPVTAHPPPPSLPAAATPGNNINNQVPTDATQTAASQGHVQGLMDEGTPRP